MFDIGQHVLCRLPPGMVEAYARDLAAFPMMRAVEDGKVYTVRGLADQGRMVFVQEIVNPPVPAPHPGQGAEPGFFAHCFVPLRDGALDVFRTALVDQGVEA
jgi:hypothetical protein